MSFAENFWTQDYNSGFQILFGQLYEGIHENDDFIDLFKKRMDSEMLYGTSLQSISTNSKPTSKRQTNDDYASTIKNVYTELHDNFHKQGQYHIDIAENIETMVLSPFEKWCKEHEQRVGYSTSTINAKYKSLKSTQAQVDKLQKKYFNKCRILEEFKSHYSEEELSEEMGDSEFHRRISASQKAAESTDEDGGEEGETSFEFTYAEFNSKQMETLLKQMLIGIPRAAHKVPILGTYQDVSTGSSITQWVLDNVFEVEKNLDKAEKFGQDLIKHDFIRVVGSMGKSFINSSQFFYQWKQKAFDVAQIIPNSNDVSSNGFSKGFGTFNFDDVKEAMGVSGVDYSDKTQYPKLLNDVKSLDLSYFEKVRELDALRCEFEELVMDHLTFMQKCELDRLKAIKKVTFDFIATFANRVKQLQMVTDELVLLEETINPVKDLKFLIENYATGYFKPHVTLYDNYYDSNTRQTFGVDLNVKSRLDKKVVPIIVQCILSHLDHTYPDLKDDEERINLWTQPVHLSSVHKLRSQLNDLSDPVKISEILSESNPVVITNVLKLYLLELPDSLIPHSFYDVIKLLYINYQDGSQKATRINGLQNVLSELPKCNIATLDALLTHLKRLVQIIGAKDKEASKSLQGALCLEFGKLILRPKTNTHSELSKSSFNDKHPVSTMQDLLKNKETIFNELRRNSSKTKSNSAANSAANSPNVSRTGSTKTRHTPPLAPSESLAAKSKSRLESRLKSAIKHKQNGQSTDQPKEEVAEASSFPQENDDADDDSKAQPESSSKSSSRSRSATPPPTPAKSPASLKRSVSPKKKRLSSMLLDDAVESTPNTPSKSRSQSGDETDA
ncbi:rga8 [Candida margitis]|uniref:rga8 n=1 Tax=Candida margitis TaxID=1775924 RepID=UPI002226EE6C|nr:rga8 [Candida margitis]KAI5970703.1 rga8 [Candida margitis]